MFEPCEFLLITGLQDVGQPINMSTKMKSFSIFRVFDVKIEVASSHDELSILLVSLTTNKDSLYDFVRLYIYFVCKCIYFPKENYSTLRLFSHAWRIR